MSLSRDAEKMKELSDQLHYLVKYTVVENGKQWWFLNEVDDLIDFSICNRISTLKSLKDHSRFARFIKRYSSAEELDIEVNLKYGSQFTMKDLSGKL